LTDRAKAIRLHHQAWYDLFYAPFSDAAHVSVVALDREATQVLAGSVMYGARFEDPRHVLMAAFLAMSAVLERLDLFFYGSASPAVLLILKPIEDILDAEMHGWRKLR
jgi:hypothetical protein